MDTLNPNPAGCGTRHHKNLAHLRGVSGAYLLQIDNQLYVGSSKNLRTRLVEWSRKFPGAKYQAIPAGNYRELEQRLLNKAKHKLISVKNINNVIAAPYQKKTKQKKIKPRGPGRKPERKITVSGVTRTLGEWCRLSGIEKGLFYARLHVGWTEQEAIKQRSR